MKMLAAISLLSPINTNQFQINWPGSYTYCIIGVLFSSLESEMMKNYCKIINWIANICKKCFKICPNYTVPNTQRDVWWNQTGKALYSSAPEAGSIWLEIYLHCTVHCSNIPESSNEIYYVYDYTENGLDGLEGWSL